MCNYIPHTPVMLKEAIKYLSPQDGETFLDCTFGAGGYSKSILDSALCNVIALDRDPNVNVFAGVVKSRYKERFEFLQVNFADSHKMPEGKKFNGIVMDLGVSSMQLDEGERGFSFMREGPLDMRMDGYGISAADFINTADEQVIADVIYRYGEEKNYKKIAGKIVYERRMNPINTTSRLADIIHTCQKFNHKIDSATKTFQAIRIYINKELESLELFLANVADLLVVGGRLVIVSFHSLEDVIVKRFFQGNSARKIARSKYAKVDVSNAEHGLFRILTKKPLCPSFQEVKLNPRARSAKLRAGVKN